MKEPEYVKSADNTTWMDNSVITTVPTKVTVIDPRVYTEAIVKVFKDLESIKNAGMTDPEIKHMATSVVHTVMQGIIAQRRAWVNGYEADGHLAVRKMIDNFGFDLNPQLRDHIRYELDFDLDKISEKVVKSEVTLDKALHHASRLKRTIGVIGTLLNTHMNPNEFVIHELTVSRDGRTFRLEEFSDWRVVQWTEAQQKEIRIRDAEL